MNRWIIAVLATGLAVVLPAVAPADPPAKLPEPVPVGPPPLAPPKVEQLPPVPIAPEPEATTSEPPAALPPTVAQPVPQTSPSTPPQPLPPMPGPAGPGGMPGSAPLPPPEDTHYGPPDYSWLSVGYLSYQFKSAPLGPAAVVVTDAAGNRTMVGGGHGDFGWANGITVNGGWWLNERHTIGVGLGGFLTEQRANGDAVSSGPGLTIFRPFTNALTGNDGQFFVAVPGFLTGSYRTESTARFAGAETYLLKNLAHKQQYTFDLLAGFRYLDLDESLTLTQTTTPTDTGFILLGGNAFPGGTPLTVTDRFRTRNQFYGGEIGIAGEYRVGAFCLGLTPKVGFGTVHQTVDVAGESRIPGLAIPGGFFALPGGNFGRTNQNRFTVLAEVQAAVGVYITSHSKLSVGYDFLYLNDVARPAGQIDPVVNPRLVPTARAFGSLSGVASPVPVAGRTDFLAHGLRVMWEYRY
jgi:hypothetical protein